MNTTLDGSFVFISEFSNRTEYALNRVDQHGLRKEGRRVGRKRRNLSNIFVRCIFIILNYKEKASNYKM